LTSQLPLSGDFDAYGASFATVPDTSPEGDGAALRYLVAGDYFAAMKIPLIRGRLLNNGDRSGAPEAILVSESYARRKFAGVNPIGQQVKFGPEISDKTRPWGTVVGVVGDVKQASLGLTPEDAFYTAIGQWPWMDATMSFVIRTSGDAAALAPAVTQAIHVVDPARAVERLQPMTTLVMSSEAERIFVMRLFEAFALATVLLAAIGIYGVLAGSVTERTREIGVRTALGATRRQVLALVAHQAMVLTVAGLTIGVGGALISSRLIATFLFGVTRFDPWTYGGVALLVGAVSGIACIVPAWRAARVDPVRALRAE
jgi:predicted permease